MIENDTLRTYVNNYIGLAVKKYEKEQRQKRKPVNEKTIKQAENGLFRMS